MGYAFAMVIITFHTTADAFGFEQACEERGIPGRLTTIPRTISAGCGLSWQADDGQRGRLEALLAEGGVECEGVYVR